MTLYHHPATIQASEALDRLRTRKVVAAGPTGGPDWTPPEQAQLLSSLEAGWPIGMLLAWAPTGHVFDTWHVLDGHRRLAVLAALHGPTSTIVRDLTANEPNRLPVYRPHPPDSTAIGYLPVAAMASTMRFLAATRGWQEPHLDHAHLACSRLLHASVTVALLLGGTEHEVTQACQRLLPGRVTPATIRAIRSR